MSFLIGHNSFLMKCDCTAFQTPELGGHHYLYFLFHVAFSTSSLHSTCVYHTPAVQRRSLTVRNGLWAASLWGFAQCSIIAVFLKK